MGITYEDLQRFLDKLGQRRPGLRATPQALAVAELFARTPPPSGPITQADQPIVSALLSEVGYSGSSGSNMRVIPPLVEEIC